MRMNEILLNLLHFVTFLAFLVLCGVFFMRNEFLIGILILGLAIFYFIFRNKKSYLSPKPALTTTESAIRIATAWMGILILVVFHIMEVPNPYWMLLVPVPLFLLLFWMVLTDRQIIKKFHVDFHFLSQSVLVVALLRSDIYNGWAVNGTIETCWYLGHGKI